MQCIARRLINVFRFQLLINCANMLNFPLLIHEMCMRVMWFPTAPAVSGVEQQIRWDFDSVSSLIDAPLPLELTKFYN